MSNAPQSSPGGRELAGGNAHLFDPRAAPAGPGLVQRVEAQVAAGKLKLPTLPLVYAELLEACQRDDVDASWLAHRVERDPSISAHVLRVANSVAFGAREPVVSLPQAIARLGSNMLRNLVLAGVLEAGVFQSRRAEPSVLELWRHCALTAGWAREIARTRRRNVEGSFLAGLLHDVGRAVLLSAAAELAGAKLDDADLATLAPYLHDRHAEVGAQLLESWKLPTAVAHAVRRHHDPDLSPDTEELALTIAMADLLSRTQTEDSDDGPSAEAESPRAHLIQLAHARAAALGLYPDEVLELSQRRAAVEELAGVFA